MNGDFSTGDLTGWTLDDEYSGVQAYVGTSGSPTNSPHMIWSFNGSAPSRLYQYASGIISDKTWYRMTMDYMMESVGPYDSGSRCHLTGQTWATQVFQQFAPNVNGFSNSDASNPCSGALIDQPVPSAGQWVHVTAYLQFPEATQYNGSPYPQDLGYPNSMVNIVANCGDGIQNTIHMDNLVLQVATECS